MALGVSTSWLSRSVTDGREIVKRIADLGAKSIEIDYRVSEETFTGIINACSTNGMSVVSMHAVCPAPIDKSYAGAAERYHLSSEDEAIRQKGVADVIATINLASDNGIDAVVIHSGRVEMEGGTEKLKAAYDAGLFNGAESMALVNNLKIDRLASVDNSFFSLIKSLDEIDEAATKMGVLIGLENRYHMVEYPNFEELAIIFLRRPESSLRYWHDTGHAQAQENLGVCPHEPYLSEYRDRLIGVHLHDTIGYKDHLAPPTEASNSVDFDMVKSYVKPETITILELGQNVSTADAKRGFDWLVKSGW